ncbi:hypothetical protein ICN48_07100 [Polynucleobacter sp. JS-Safj-400b-B2]|uniref:hypothetical protein n=1 Tax=Polynucleobacter sp. JS-Safj-400b-B2 TaxID=2576921 RepID=UPI001C0B9C3C|nr:hypothetical protein [Polynucleobacter sp. JS-Safj-400b-B2]MBU3626000.1 hypothetical protein [Polynucleobacter sp. JS-Safj-400b-B2]
MHYLRLKHATNTRDAADNLIELMNKPECIESYFVRTLSSEDSSVGEADFLPTNFPLVVGFLRFSLSEALEDIVIVFDGFHMTGVRARRGSELLSVLAAAANSNKAFVSDQQVSFTSSLPAEAAHAILSSAIYRPMGAESLNEDLRLLSSGYASAG